MKPASRVMPMLSVADVARAMEFYADVLGGEKVYQFPLCVNVTDVDATVETLRSRGFSVAMEATDQPWGERAAYVEDPDGNLVLLVAPVAEP